MLLVVLRCWIVRMPIWANKKRSSARGRPRNQARAMPRWKEFWMFFYFIQLLLFFLLNLPSQIWIWKLFYWLFLRKKKKTKKNWYNSGISFVNFVCKFSFCFSSFFLVVEFDSCFFLALRIGQKFRLSVWQNRTHELVKEDVCLIKVNSHTEELSDEKSSVNYSVCLCVCVFFYYFGGRTVTQNWVKERKKRKQNRVKNTHINWHSTTTTTAKKTATTTFGVDDVTAGPFWEFS